jgi:serine/threonine protein kinase
MTSSAAPPEAGANLVVDAPSALPTGARVAEFEIRGVLGSGGFGIVYLAWDHALEREVALKEYMPSTLAGRAGDLSVSVRSQSMADTFALGLRSFVNEARLLARFDHPSLVKVYRFWEDNGTAYMVMPYYKGRTLRKVRAGMVLPPGEGACRAVLEALLSALETLHKEGTFHRDIAPDNILIGDDGVPVLLDFGAARRVIGEGQQALTSIMKPHFAPLEQYADQGAMRQGPWTDLYALGGTIYFLLTGQEPVPAASRALHDDQPRLGELGLQQCSSHFLATIDWMMAIKPPERPQSVQMLRDVLEGRITVPGRAARERERTVPGIASRDTVDILTSPGDLAPEPELGATDSAGAPTVLMPRPTTVEPMPQPAAPAPAPASAASRLPQRSSLMVLAALAVLNVLAWWWFTRSEAPPAPVTAARPAAAPAAADGPSGGSAEYPVIGTAAADTAPATPAAGAGNETILSVLPARLPKAAPAASAVGTAAVATLPASAAVAPLARPGDAPLARTPLVDAAAARVAADAAARSASAALKPAVVDAGDPRARCGDRNYFSLLVCLKRECQNPVLAAHPECVRLREQEAGARPSSER